MPICHSCTHNRLAQDFKTSDPICQFCIPTPIDICPIEEAIKATIADEVERWANDRVREYGACIGPYHSGMTSMAYAYSSTGSLTRGTIRPDVESDVEWLLSLWESFEGEVIDSVKWARLNEDDELETLEELLHGCNAVVSHLGSILEWDLFKA